MYLKHENLNSYFQNPQYAHNLIFFLSITTFHDHENVFIRYMVLFYINIISYSSHDTFYFPEVYRCEEAFIRQLILIQFKLKNVRPSYYSISLI